MRARLIMAAVAAVAGFGFSQSAAAGGWDDSHCCGGTVYVHHHVYHAPRYKHVYHIHRPGPRHVHVMHDVAPGCCVAYGVPPRGSYFAPRYRWHWRGYGRNW